MLFRGGTVFLFAFPGLCGALAFHAMSRNAFAGPILAAHSKAFALPSLPSTPRLRSAVKCHTSALQTRRRYACAYSAFP
jgi:hypothetical protein